MKFITREYVSLINIYDFDDFLLKFLKEKYENKCFNEEIILKINKILTRSDFNISQEDFIEDKIFVDICFEAECSKIKPKTLAVFVVDSIDKETLKCKIPITATCKINKLFYPDVGNVFIGFIKNISYIKGKIPSAVIEPFKIKKPLCMRCVDTSGLFEPPKKIEKHGNFEIIRSYYEKSLKSFKGKTSVFDPKHSLITSKAGPKAEKIEGPYIYLVIYDLSISEGYFEILKNELPQTRNEDMSIWESLTVYSRIVENYNECLNQLAEHFKNKEEIEANKKIWNFLI